MTQEDNSNKPPLRKVLRFFLAYPLVVLGGAAIFLGTTVGWGLRAAVDAWNRTHK